MPNMLAMIFYSIGYNLYGLGYQKVMMLNLFFFIGVFWMTFQIPRRREKFSFIFSKYLKGKFTL